jgi:hypothetical protein
MWQYRALVDSPTSNLKIPSQTKLKVEICNFIPSAYKSPYSIFYIFPRKMWRFSKWRFTIRKGVMSFKRILDVRETAKVSIYTTDEISNK